MPSKGKAAFVSFWYQSLRVVVSSEEEEGESCECRPK